MHSYFQELGKRVHECWVEQNFSPDAFPQIAVSALEARPPAGHVNLEDLMREFLMKDDQPLQSASGFGQPELIVYDDPRFYIQVLFWLDGTTDIHQHGFSGAFHVMEGSSLHSRFEFEDARSITAHMRVGNLKLREAHLLETGSTVPIESGSACIHSLFHLDSPSVTVVIRTHSDPGGGPQFTYLPPHVAVDPLQNDALTLRRKQLLDVVEQTGDAAYGGWVLEMIETLDFERGFFILQNGVVHLRNLGVWDEVLEAFSNKHGALAAVAEPTLDEIIRRDGIAAMRRMIEDPDHRFFLALLLNVDDRESVLRMVGERYSGEPVETILQWAGELTQANEFSTWMLDAEFPVDPGIDVENQPAIFQGALRYFLLKKKSLKKPAGISSGDLGAIRDVLARSSWRVLLPAT